MTTLPTAIFPETDFARSIYAGKVGFGGVLFTARNLEGWPDWVGEPSIVTRRIPGSNTSVTQFLGHGPERCRYSLGLASQTDFSALKALVGTEGTLTLPVDTAALDATVIYEVGTIYQQMTDVLLALIDASSIRRRIGGIVLCEVEFQRDRVS